jgi:tRNA A37 threonylcarbamoyladenosine dehydratase
MLSGVKSVNYSIDILKTKEFILYLVISISGNDDKIALISAYQRKNDPNKIDIEDLNKTEDEN